MSELPDDRAQREEVEDEVRLKQLKEAIAEEIHKATYRILDHDRMIHGYPPMWESEYK